MKRCLLSFALFFVVSSAGSGLPLRTNVTGLDDPNSPNAYEVLVFRKAVVRGDLAEMASRYTDEYLCLRLRRLELELIDRELEQTLRIEKRTSLRPPNSYGILVLRRISKEVELAALLAGMTDDHPNVARSKAEISVLQAETDRIIRRLENSGSR